MIKFRMGDGVVKFRSGGTMGPPGIDPLTVLDFQERVSAIELALPGLDEDPDIAAAGVRLAALELWKPIVDEDLDGLGTTLAGKADDADVRVETGYGSTAALVAVSSTAFVDVPGVVCNFTPGDKINWLDFGAYVQLSTPGASASVILSFQVVNIADGSIVATWNHRCYIAAGTGVDLRWHTKRQRLGLLPAGVARSYKVQAKIGTAGHGGTLWGGAGTETYLATEER